MRISEDILTQILFKRLGAELSELRNQFLIFNEKLEEELTREAAQKIMSLTSGGEIRTYFRLPYRVSYTLFSKMVVAGWILSSVLFPEEASVDTVLTVWADKGLLC